MDGSTYCMNAILSALYISNKERSEYAPQSAVYVCTNAEIQSLIILGSLYP